MLAPVRQRLLPYDDELEGVCALQRMFIQAGEYMSRERIGNPGCLSASPHCTSIILMRYFHCSSIIDLPFQQTAVYLHPNNCHLQVNFLCIVPHDAYVMNIQPALSFQMFFSCCRISCKGSMFSTYL